MRILIFPNSYLPVVGGLQSVTYLLAQHLVRKGHAVEIVANRYPRSLRAEERIGGVPVHRWLLLTPAIRDLWRGRFDLFCASLYFYPLNLFRFFRLVHKFKPEVINVHFPDAQAPLILWLRKKFRFRLVVSLHGDEIERWFYSSPFPPGHTSKQKLKALKSILQKADVVTACSGFLLKEAVQLAPSIVGKSLVIYNGVEEVTSGSVTPYLHARQYIFSYGRFTYKKGFDILLKAFAQVIQKCPEADLIVAGDGQEKNNLEQLVDTLGLQNRVLFYGYAGQEEIRRLLAGCQCMVVPSRREPFGMVILEAMALGKPVIATRSGGPEEIIKDGINGMLVEKENPGALAEGIIALFGNNQLQNKLSISSTDSTKSFNASNMACQYLEVFKLYNGRCQ